MPRTAAPLSAVFATILILIGLLIFLLVYDDLRSKLWVQGLAGMIMTLIVAVILFSIVYSAMQVRGAALWGGVLGISGAAAFYLLLLPMIKTFIFPTHSISGYVFYKTSSPDDPLTPVRGVTAEVPATGQKSAETDASGRFVIDSVYADETNIQFQHGGKTYPAKTTDHQDGRYAIIPPPSVEPDPVPRRVVGVWTKEAARDYECELMSEKQYVAASGFTLTVNLPRNDVELSRDAKKLHLKVSLPPEFGDLTQPNDMEPQTSIDFLDVSDVEGRVLGWEWSKIDVNQQIKIGLCVNRRKGDRVATPSDLRTIYWYGAMR